MLRCGKSVPIHLSGHNTCLSVSVCLSVCLSVQSIGPSVRISMLCPPLISIQYSTTAGIIAEYHHVHSSTSKKVDFVLTLEPGADPNPHSAAAAVRQIEQIRSRSPCFSINHTAFEPLLKCPIAVSIETKRPGGGGSSGAEGATVQAGVWAAAQWSLLQARVREQQQHLADLPELLYLPAVVVVGHDWTLAATTRSGPKTVGLPASIIHNIRDQFGLSLSLSFSSYQPVQITIPEYTEKKADEFPLLTYTDPLDRLPHR